MSQDGWMLGLIGNNETYSNDIYTGFKYQIGYGEVGMLLLVQEKWQEYPTIN